MLANFAKAEPLRWLVVAALGVIMVLMHMEQGIAAGSKGSDGEPCERFVKADKQ